jgi:CDP-paratose 2-epimerase
MQKPRKDVPRIVNLSGGIRQSASLRELSDWCENRFGKGNISGSKETRPFDVPWLVLDSSLAKRVWDWTPKTSIEDIWSEIAQHADANPRWLEMTADA